MDATLKRIRENVLKISNHSGHGHIPTCFSVIELIKGTYDIMTYNPKEPDWKERDLFILSKGHAALGYYCVLAELGYFPIENVYSFGSYGAQFGCHPDRSKIPGVELSTGSLGHGIGVAAGMALGLKVEGSSRKVYVLIGDGESNEGTVWEAVMVAAGQQLENLTILVDHNHSQTRCLPLKSPAEKFRAFGCNVLSINGHSPDELTSALKEPNSDSPKVIVADTRKGYGCPSLVRDMFAWHRRSPNDDEVNALLKELHDATNE